MAEVSKEQEKNHSISINTRRELKKFLSENEGRYWRRAALKIFGPKKNKDGFTVEEKWFWSSIKLSPFSPTPTPTYSLT